MIQHPPVDDLPRDVAPFARARANGSQVGALIALHPVAATFVLALLVRAAAAVVLQASLGGLLFPDERLYHDVARHLAAGRTAFAYTIADGLVTRVPVFIEPLTALYTLIGPNVLAARLLVAIVGATAAAGVTAVALTIGRPTVALVSGLIAALLPSAVLWSSAILKDAFVWAALALLAFAYARAAPEPRKLLPWLSVVVMVLLLVGLRPHTAVIAVWAVVGAAWWSAREQHGILRGVTTLMIALLVPFVGGLGPGGLHLLTAGAPVPQVRAAMAELTPPDACVRLSDPDVTTSAMELVAGLGLSLLEPYPWRVNCGPAIRFAAIESLIWYALLALAAVGALGHIRRAAAVRLGLLWAFATLGLAALTQADLFTAYRHRAELIWVVALLAPHGAVAIWRRYRPVGAAE